MPTRTARARISLDDVLRPISGTCGKCRGPMTIYPAGSVCLAGCSPSWVGSFFAYKLNQERAAHGLVAL